MPLFTRKSDEAIVTLLVTHQADLLAYTRSLLPTQMSHTRDVLQRANIVIWKKRKTFEIGTNFKAWAFSIVRWQVKAFQKENQRNAWLIVDDDLTEKITNNITDSDHDESIHDLRAALEACIQKLKPSDQSLLNHRYHTDGTLIDFAEEHQQSVGALRVTLHRIRATLKRCIEARKNVQPLSPPRQP